VQDKIGFIFNNLSLSNIQIKGDELVDIVKDDFWDWIAHYLVVKRVSIEPNFHTLYSMFIDTLKADRLSQTILAETYRNIKVLLRSDKNDQKFCDRALLKNLGSWLGLITLAKNKPILQNDIDLKSLTVEAFQKGQTELLFVVPFVAKVLEPASKSKVFLPPNPWLMAMISTLVELHNEPDLKLNHKFEIEVLCKNLNINIQEVTMKNVLRNFEITEEQLTKQLVTQQQQQQANMPSSSMPAITPQPNPATTIPSQPNNNNPRLNPETAPYGDSTATYPNQQANVYVNVQAVQPKYKLADIKIQSIMHNENLVYINQDIPLFNALKQDLPLYNALKSLIVPTLDKVVSDIMPMLLDKTIKVSVSTAEPLIKKDFALDPDESHMRTGARNMVANMSSGMMLITGKEPLTTHLLNVLKTQLSQPLDVALAHQFKDMIAQACATIVQDNIELCMCFLQKNAIHKAITELEKKLQPELEIRQKARNEGRSHYDASVLVYQNERMPESIRIKIGSLNQQQFSVYEEFGKTLPGFKSHVEEKTVSNGFLLGRSVCVKKTPVLYRRTSFPSFAIFLQFFMFPLVETFFEEIRHTNKNLTPGVVDSNLYIQT
jgi:CCR4-NOT transcription complex subunit 1